MQDNRPNQPDAKPLPPPLPPPEKSAAAGGASAIGRLETKNAGYDQRSAPFEQKKAPEGKLPAGSEDPIQKSKAQEGLQKIKEAPHNAVEAAQKKVAETKENPVPLMVKGAKQIVETAANQKFGLGDTKQIEDYAKIGGRGMIAQVETKFPNAAEKVHGAAGKIGETANAAKEKAGEVLQDMKDKLTPPPKDPQGPLFR